jgi:hypothetical protein
MPSAVIDKGLLADALVDVVDDIRRAVHGALGTRPFDVTVVQRRWSSGRVGEGTPVDSKLLLDPPPEVTKRGRDRSGPGGREEVGDATLAGVSLRYTEAELAPPDEPGLEVVYQLDEKHGQRIAREFYSIAGKPTPRRGDQPGDGSDWLIILNQVQGFADFDRVDG